MRKQKKAQATSTLVIMVAGIMGLLVLLMVTGTFGKLFQSITGKNECQMEFLISSFTKTAGAQTTDPNCEPHLVTIDEKLLKDNTARATKSVKAYKDKYSQKKLETAQKYYEYFETANHEEWVMDETIAKEMKYCWDITGQGKLDLFSNWNGWLVCGTCQEEGKNCETDTHPCTREEIEDVYKDPVHKTLGTVAGLGGIILGDGIYGKAANGAVAYVGVPLASKVMFSSEMNIANSPPVFCVLCARVKFDPKIQSKDEVKSLKMWMDNNPVTDTGSYSKVPYSAYIQNDAYKGIWSNKDAYTYTPNQAYAIVYARVNTFGVEKYYNSMVDVVQGNEGKIDDIQTIKLVPYKEIKTTCSMLVG